MRDQIRSLNKHEGKCQIVQRRPTERAYVQRDKIGGEGERDVFQRNRAEYPREPRLERVDPEEQHSADGFLCYVIDPKDEPNMNELCRSVGEGQFAPGPPTVSRRP
jgi:hypothetical protein